MCVYRLFALHYYVTIAYLWYIENPFEKLKQIYIGCLSLLL